VVLLLAVFLAGCGSLTLEEQVEAQYYATMYAKDPQHNVPPPKYQTLAATALGMYLPATPVPTSTPDPHWTPTMSGFDFSSTQIAQQQNYQSTQNAMQLQLERERLAAEERARQEAEEAKQALATAIALNLQQTAEARVWFANETAHAESTKMMATAQWQATATMFQWAVNDQATMAAGTATAVQAPTHYVWTQEAIYLQSTVEAGAAAQVELAVIRQQRKNLLDAYLPWALLVAACVVVGYIANRYLATRPHVRDASGAMPLLERRTSAGIVFIRPDIIETGVVKVGDDGSIVRYAPMDRDEQSDINRRGQAIEAIRALPSPYAGTAQKIMTTEFSRGSTRVTINPNGSMGPALDEAERQFLEEAAQ